MKCSISPLARIKEILTQPEYAEMLDLEEDVYKYADEKRQSVFVVNKTDHQRFAHMYQCESPSGSICYMFHAWVYEQIGLVYDNTCNTYETNTIEDTMAKALSEARMYEKVGAAREKALAVFAAELKRE